MNLRQAGLGIAAAAVIVSPFFFGERSRLNLNEVHPHLQIVAECAIKRTTVDFVVVDGGRTDTEHKINVANGKSWVKRSRHQDGMAIDFAALKGGKITFLHEYYPPIVYAFKECSKELNIPIVSGADWKVKDMMHIELDRKTYP